MLPELRLCCLILLYFVTTTKAVDEIYELAKRVLTNSESLHFNSTYAITRSLYTLRPFNRDTGILGYIKIRFSNDSEVDDTNKQTIVIKEVCTNGQNIFIEGEAWKITQARPNNSNEWYKCMYPIYPVMNKVYYPNTPVSNEQFFIRTVLCFERGRLESNDSFVRVDMYGRIDKPFQNNCASALFAPIRLRQPN
ncbi:hypothetical protein AX774_g2624 [Zancudomyces culisetae]|uniref:Uncharacterized protein n=1 Tax=Zancudomyces culisetae TaxID=1213189 RepID=A0A1R1PSG5_ZANCU|nr:hypothetical protein AX774_g2624 [Zancudomyces culisetae]|eukprot:OMH83869.1 hypothetical protein AX774_g2624 [Zancudomyces culisetae]